MNIYLLKEVLPVNDRISTDTPFRLKVFYTYQSAVFAFLDLYNETIRKGIAMEKFELIGTWWIRVKSREPIATYHDGWVTQNVFYHIEIYPLFTDLTQGWIGYHFSCCDWNYQGTTTIEETYEDAIQPIESYFKRMPTTSGAVIYSSPQGKAKILQVRVCGHTQVACMPIEFKIPEIILKRK